jgi:hypothetical protein
MLNNIISSTRPCEPLMDALLSARRMGAFRTSLASEPVCLSGEGGISLESLAAASNG